MIDQMDVISAFLNGTIDTTVYLVQPEGFSLGLRTSMFCILYKSIYGLCQAARIWYNVLHSALVEIGFIRLFADLACWFKITTVTVITFVIAYVDDTLSVGNKDEVKEIKDHLKRKFKTKDIREGKVFIELNLSRDREKGLILINQAHYAKALLDTYGILDCNPVSCLITPGEVLVRGTDLELLSPTEKKLYQAIVGSLSYLMNCSRLDLAHSVTKHAQFATYPTKSHMAAAKHVLRYLKRTMNVMLTLGSSDAIKEVDSKNYHQLTAYFDSSWADDKDDSCSIFRYIVMYGTNPLVWKSKKHKSVSSSRIDAEYLAATETTYEICWILNLFRGLQLEIQSLVTLFGDNENANNLANRISSNNRTRHIDIRQRYVTEKVSEGVIKVVWIPTSEQITDIFTKTLPRPTLNKLCSKMRVYLLYTQTQTTHTCSICLTSFKSNNTLHRHIRHMHLGKGKCQRCVYVHTNKILMIRLRTMITMRLRTIITMRLHTIITIHLRTMIMMCLRTIIKDYYNAFCAHIYDFIFYCVMVALR